MTPDHFLWWNNLRHGGLLLDIKRLSRIFEDGLPLLTEQQHRQFRRERNRFENSPDGKPDVLADFILGKICGFDETDGKWYRGSRISTDFTRYNLMGEAVRPSRMYLGNTGCRVPVFTDTAKRLGVGRGKRALSNALQWLRRSETGLALVTNGRQWRLVFAGLDYDAWCEWDMDQWLAEGKPTDEFRGFIGLLSPHLWIPADSEKPCPLAAAINDARKGQADLSQELGERVRQATELLIHAHAPALNRFQDRLASEDIYRAAVRIIMRIVVVLFAESREGLLPVDNRIYHGGYGINGLRDMLSRMSPHRRESGYYGYPRLLALFRLIYYGSGHEAMPVPAYGGTLFAPGDPGSSDDMQAALYLLENECFQADLVNDRQVLQMLRLLSTTRIYLRQGRSRISVNTPVDFSSLKSDYIGILYEGLLDFELHRAEEDQPVIFLAVGNHPALPLTVLESMDNRAIRDLLSKLKDTSSGMDDVDEQENLIAPDPEDASDSGDGGEDEDDEEDTAPADEDESEDTDEPDARVSLQQRAQAWARHACEVGGLVTKPRGRITPESQMQYERAVAVKAGQLIKKVVLPGEWYLVRWGGTRKGAGTFYTRPQLAIATVHRTLLPLVYEPPTDAGGTPQTDAPFDRWIPKKPEQILKLKVCDPACGSGSFPLAALRFLTDALYESLILHDRVRRHAERSVLALICDTDETPLLTHEDLPCRPDDDDFDVMTKAVLRRYVVERCIYGVDLDPLAVELCRLSLWIETIDPRLPMTFLKHKIKCGNSLVGAWFDTFQHYPAMAWNREGGDTGHTNGVHFPKGQWTRAVKDGLLSVKNELKDILDQGQKFQMVDILDVKNEHESAEKTLNEIHEIGIAQVRERAEKYDELRKDQRFTEMKDAFNLWCAIWFWPADQIDHVPMPEDFYSRRISMDTRNIVRQIAAKRRFFHWELEFPDVFNSHSAGFDAVLGNPPWDISKPVSMEFFSAIDPLYRGYGKQDAIAHQKKYFKDSEIEHHWLEYNAFFKAMSNWNKFAGHPFGDRITTDAGNRQKHDLPIGDRGRSSFETSEKRHDRWRRKRKETTGFADPDHPFRHQGGGDINLYKMFLEQAHTLLARGGRMGFIVPSGLYSDHGTGALRTLFLKQCKWEWLFGFENRNKVFDIDGRFKFNPVIIEKGSRTVAIRTAFMHRDMADWENAERYAIEYPLSQVTQFSPHSRAILEIRSERDLEILEKIYGNSVLLGDQSPDGWGIRYAREFDMTNDSKLFPPRPRWEEWGYRPDEYSRWIKGPWRPIEALYAEMGARPPEKGERRCAQPPYDRLSIPRADIPEGIILSRDATQFIRETDIPEVTFTEASGKPLKIKVGRGKDAREIEIRGPAIALPLYEGRMIGQFDFSEKGWVSGKGRSAVWREIPWDEKVVEPQYLLSLSALQKSKLKAYLDHVKFTRPGYYQIEKDNLSSSKFFSHWWYKQIKKVSFMDICSATNTRTMISSFMHSFPNGHSAPMLRTDNLYEELCIFVNSLIFDAIVRLRTSGLHLVWAVLAETPLPRIKKILIDTALTCFQLNQCNQFFAPQWIEKKNKKHANASWKKYWALTQSERLRIRCIAESISGALMKLHTSDFFWMIRECDLPIERIKRNESTSFLNPKNFWRVDKEKHPEHRLTILSLIAFHDLQDKIKDCGGDTEKGIKAFMVQNDGEGWMLPETLRLADYGLGHDERAKDHQPVRDCFGPRFLDWQLAQPSEESWKECRLHARNLLGRDGYQALLDQMNGKTPQPEPKKKEKQKKQIQLSLFEED